MPWPIRNRAGYASTNALIHDDAVDINLKTVNEDFYLDESRPIIRDDGCEEMDMQGMLLKVKRIEQNKQMLRGLMMVDPKCNIPDWLLNNISKVVAAAFMT